MLRRIPWALVASAIALSATPGSAQVGGVDTALVRVLDRVRPGSDVRVAAGQGAMHRGTLRKLTAAELVVTEDAVERTMPLTAIDTVWVARRSTGRGAWTGALVGLGVGAIVGTAAGANWEDTPQIAGTLLGGGAGALGGLLFGTALGAASSHEVRAYPD